MKFTILKIRYGASGRFGGFGLIALGCIFISMHHAIATTRTWLPQSGDWNMAPYWSGGIAPTSNDDVVIENGGTIVVPTGSSGTSNFLYAGKLGSGNLNINGGSVSNAYANLGYSVGAYGTVNVTGGSWTNSALLYIGYSGAGAFSMNGGSVADPFAYLGYNLGGYGTAVINNGTWTNSSNLWVGVSGSGSLTINGGNVSSSYVNLGFGAGSYGAATVTGGHWINSGIFNVGNSGSGTLNLSGGIIDDSAAYLGFGAGTHGTAAVTGGTWTSASGFFIGYSGSGTLSVSGNGTVSVNDGAGLVRIASQVGSTGILNIGTGGTAGTPNAANISGGSGVATVNFNHTGNYTLASQLTGNLSVNQVGLGTTILSAVNSYAGATRILAGELKVNGSISAASAVTVGDGAVLSGSGVVKGTVDVNGTLKGTLTTGTISGSGLVSPGNTPGILTSDSVDISNGLSFAFEFTLANTNPIYSNAVASGNDILHLTGAAPFSGNLAAGNLVSIYLQSAVVGDFYLAASSPGLAMRNLKRPFRTPSSLFLSKMTLMERSLLIARSMTALMRL